MPPEHPLLGRLRWDLGAGYMRLAGDGTRGGDVNVGVAMILHPYFSFDVGARLTVGETLFDGNTGDAIAEIVGRMYIPYFAPTGIDECGKGSKVRKSTEHAPGVPFFWASTGYGYERLRLPSADGSRNAFLLGTGIGYELNLNDAHAIFVQAGWRFDVVGATSLSAPRIGGYFAEAGLRY